MSGMLDWLLQFLVPQTRQGWVILGVIVLLLALIVGGIWAVVTLLIELDETTRSD